MKNKYIIDIEGCHDNTVFVMELTDCEMQIILEVARKSQETSFYGCMPIMYVKDYTKENIEYYCLEEEIEDE